MQDTASKSGRRVSAACKSCIAHLALLMYARGCVLALLRAVGSFTSAVLPLPTTNSPTPQAGPYRRRCVVGVAAQAGGVPAQRQATQRAGGDAGHPLHQLQARDACVTGRARVCDPLPDAETSSTRELPTTGSVPNAWHRAAWQLPCSPLQPLRVPHRQTDRAGGAVRAVDRRHICSRLHTAPQRDGVPAGGRQPRAAAGAPDMGDYGAVQPAAARRAWVEGAVGGRC